MVFYFWASCLAAGISIGLLLRLGLAPALVPAQKTAGRPAHWLLRLVWPWILALAPVCGLFVSWRSRRVLARAVDGAGLEASLWLPERVAAAQCLAAVAGFFIGLAIAFAVAAMRPGVAIGVAAAMGAVGGAWPRLILRERAARRKRMMLREFPFLVDITTLCVESGLNLAGALELAAADSPDGPLRQELRYALADMRAGMPRMDALSNLAHRTDLPALRQWVAALAQADRLGMSLGPLLRAQSEQRRAERFLRAEKLALEAPVKMLFPLVVCIFPCTFLVIGFPIAIRLMGAMT